MFSLQVTIIIAILSLVMGAAAGWLLARAKDPNKQLNEELEEQLSKAEATLHDYQEQVSTHFSETSQLVNDLTHSYRQVHQHLASGAMKLADPDISRKLIDAGNGKLLAPETEDKGESQQQNPLSSANMDTSDSDDSTIERSHTV